MKARQNNLKTAKGFRMNDPNTNTGIKWSTVLDLTIEQFPKFESTNFEYFEQTHDFYESG